jgi:hypothetical protein
MTQPTEREKQAIALLTELVDAGCWEYDHGDQPHDIGTPVCHWCGMRQEDDKAEPKHLDDCTYVSAQRFLQQVP